MIEKGGKLELKFAKFLGKTAVDVQLILERLKLQTITQLNILGCGRTALGYVFHDHQVPEEMKLRALDRAEVWVLDEKTKRYIPYDPKHHGKWRELNLNEGQRVIRAPKPHRATAVHDHMGTHQFGVIEYRIK